MAAAFQFMSVTPPVVRRLFTPVEIGAATSYFSLVGLALGAVLVILYRGLHLFLPVMVVAGLCLATWEYLTGILHLDGFLDTCDGLFGGFTAEERLRILRDERVGAYAVVGGVILILLKYAALVSSASPLKALLAAPILGRWGIVLALVLFPYARSQGLGRDMKDHAGRGRLAIASAIALPAAVLAAGWLGLAAAALAAIIAFVFSRFTVSRIPGLTGDVYGAVCQLVEVAVLVLFCVR